MWVCGGWAGKRGGKGEGGQVRGEWRRGWIKMVGALSRNMAMEGQGGHLKVSVG